MNNDPCNGATEKISFSGQGFTLDYQGNESLKFLHNKSDTQTFIGQGKKTYYTTHPNISLCQTDYEACTILFINKNTNDSFNYLLENTRYQYQFKGIIFDNITYSTVGSLNVNNTHYNYVSYFGRKGIDTDTNNCYMALAYQKGFIKIKLNSEIWELIP